MRKLCLLSAIILLGAPSAALAQTPAFGLKGGLNLARFGGERIVASNYRTGPAIGLFASIPLSSTIAIQPEIIFARKGAESAGYDYDQFPQDGTAPPLGVYIGEQTSHDYLEIPVLLKFGSAGADNTLRPILLVGPSVGFLLRTDESMGIDYSEYLDTVDFGMVIGAGLERGRLSLDARYNLGLATIEKDYDLGDTIATGAVKNRAFTVSAAFRIF